MIETVGSIANEARKTDDARVCAGLAKMTLMGAESVPGAYAGHYDQENAHEDVGEMFHGKKGKGNAASLRHIKDIGSPATNH